MNSLFYIFLTNIVQQIVCYHVYWFKFEKMYTVHLEWTIYTKWIISLLYNWPQYTFFLQKFLLFLRLREMNIILYFIFERKKVYFEWKWMQLILPAYKVSAIKMRLKVYLTSYNGYSNHFDLSQVYPLAHCTRAFHRALNICIHA